MMSRFCFASRRRQTRWPRDWSSDVLFRSGRGGVIGKVAGYDRDDHKQKQCHMHALKSHTAGHQGVEEPCQDGQPGPWEDIKHRINSMWPEVFKHEIRRCCVESEILLSKPRHKIFEVINQLHD